MKLSGQTITVILTDEGKAVLSLASVGLPDTHQVLVSVEESEDLGIWIRVPRESQMHFFLLRWEYVLGIDLPSGMGRVIGMRGLG